MYEKGSEKRFRGNNDGLLLLIPVSKGFENVDTESGIGDDSINVVREAEMSAESNP